MWLWTQSHIVSISHDWKPGLKQSAETSLGKILNPKFIQMAVPLAVCGLVREAYEDQQKTEA